MEEVPEQLQLAVPSGMRLKEAVWTNGEMPWRSV